MYQLSFYVPAAQVDVVKQAVFDAGGGRIGNYDSCCWQVAGQGQFRPLPGSDPAVGGVGQLERIDEFKVEMVCADAFIVAAVAALRRAHPYEEPAYQVWKLESF
jgi:hypothetical protein